MQFTFLRNATALSAALLALLAGCGMPQENNGRTSEAWDDENAPAKLVEGFEDNFAALPLTGEAAQMPWPGSYWPNSQGGLSSQWNGNPGVRKPDLEKARAMTPELIAKLSPAEKYDLLNRSYDYPLTRYEENRTDPDQPTWWGLCHGWAQAASHFSEPGAVTVENADGISIAFGSSDIKALLTFAQQYNRPYDAMKFLGRRCDTDLPNSDSDDPNCKGVNPGSLHIVLANHIGMNRQPFMADVRRGPQVWTYPIYSFASKVIEESDDVYDSAAEGTTKIIHVETEVKHPNLIGPSWDPIGNPASGQFATESYKYTLELNADGMIIGGEWDVEDRPDFMWTQTAPVFEGFFKQLGVLYEKATAQPD